MLNRLRDVFASLNSHEVEYVVIGGMAAILHGVPRATFDLDMLIEATPENAGRLLEALREAGFGTAGLITPDELAAHEITIFKDRYRIDVQTRTPGLTFADAWARRVEMKVEGQPFWVASKEDVIRSKRAAGRKIDLEDARLLETGPEDRA
jgi:hypothetical protein